jgi:predicted nuclease of predicted toxin-antitoxin system
MKFLLDENLPPSLANLLQKEGYEARHVKSVGLGETFDSTIVEFAAQTEEIILTHDLDFGGLMARSGKQKPSVILFRLRPVTIASYLDVLLHYLPQLELDLDAGAFIVIDSQHIRIRMLPFQ